MSDSRELVENIWKDHCQVVGSTAWEMDFLVTTAVFLEFEGIWGKFVC